MDNNDLRKWNKEGNLRRCRNCTKLCSIEDLTKNYRCRKCWNEETKHRRNNTIKEYQKVVKSKWDLIEIEYFNKGEKKCNTCKDIKSFTSFYIENNTWDGRQNKCILCTKDYNSNNNPYEKINNRKKHKEYYDFQRKNNPQFKISLNLRNRLKDQVKKYNKNSNFKSKYSAIDLVGIPIEDFVSYIEEQWVKGYMNWENHGEVWELDHILPISSFNLLNENELKECFYYENYQPLFKFTTIIEGVTFLGNRNKSNKIL